MNGVDLTNVEHRVAVETLRAPVRDFHIVVARGVDAEQQQQHEPLTAAIGDAAGRSYTMPPGGTVPPYPARNSYPMTTPVAGTVRSSCVFLCVLLLSPELDNS